MYITEVSGHHRATLAIEQSLRALNQDIELRKVNGFGYLYPRMEKVVNKTYMGVIKTTPRIWNYLYDNPRVYRRTKRIKEIIHKKTHRKLSQLLNEFKPDTIICTQAFPCGLVADYKVSHHLDVDIIGVLTDYAPHSYWLHEGVDYYVIPSQETKDRFLKEGVPEERIKLFGLPVDPKFSEELDKKEIAIKLGLNDQIPTLLIMGGGQGLGPIKKIVASLIKSAADFQIIVLAGTNKKVLTFLRKVQKRNLKKMIFFEFTDQVHELMTLATLVITKPGGMTTAEALSKGLPMVIVKPIPGQEMYNAKYLLEKGVAIRVNHINKIAQDIEPLLNDQEKLKSMSHCALAISHPHSSIKIAQFIFDLEKTRV